jgi:phosphomannomutase
MAGIFKAYDIRGVYPTELDEETAGKIGRAFPVILDDSDRQGPLPGTVVVSRDMRSHSVPLQEALVEGLRAAGLSVLDIGLATTPMNYFTVGSTGAAGGIQVTASHNPARYNGFKLSRRDARPVSGDHGIPLLERTVLTGDFPTAKRPGGYGRTEVFSAYRQRVLEALHRPAGARPLKVVTDAANGMGTLYRPILEATGIDLIPLYFELDGTFPNHEANPLKEENLEDLKAAVREHGANLGVAFDGDADRAAFVDETGQAAGSDLITALIGGELLGRQPGRAVLYDLRSSRAVAEHITALGGIPVRERVGHSFMKATLRERDGIFGGELAGHYYFRDAYCADSAILAVIEILDLLWRTEKPLSVLLAPLKRYAKSPEINFEVRDKEEKMADLARRYADGQIDHLDGITVQYSDWWFNVRPSNTEPYLRLVLEATTAADLERRKGELVAIIGAPV